MITIAPTPAPFQSRGIARSVHLTIREKQILGLVSQGYSSKEIATSLVLSKRTVDFHLQNVFGKLQVNNRIRAIREARRLELLD